MRRIRPIEDSARSWRQFCRAGRRLAWLFAALWFGALTLLVRVAPAPAPAPRPAAAPMEWRPAAGGEAVDIRALWSPAAFALPTPAGFSHSLRRERARLVPPVEIARPETAFLERPPPAAPSGPDAEDVRFAARTESAAEWPAGGIFPPRVAEPETARMVFPEGWESRLFSGIDLNFGAWTNEAWSARVEMRFDAHGIPVSTLLAQSSGRPELDVRLARSASGWRLLEPAAPRTGVVAWSSPSFSGPAAAGAGEESP